MFLCAFSHESSRKVLLAQQYLISFDDETMHLQGIFIEDDELENIIKNH